MSKFEALNFTFVFMLRRLAFAYTICHLDSTITVQILIIDGMSTALLYFYVGSWPMVDSINNYTQIFNELIILVCTWSLFLFTDYVPDPKLRHKFGEVFIYILALNLIVNLMILAYSIAKKIQVLLKETFCKRQGKVKSILKKKQLFKTKKNRVGTAGARTVCFKSSSSESSSSGSSSSGSGSSGSGSSGSSSEGASDDASSSSGDESPLTAFDV